MIVAFTGGTGGAKLVEGLAALLDAAELTIVCNSGDDCIFHGLYISPDIDTITYTLAGLSDTKKGWGIKGDTFTTLEQLRRLGSDAWFHLGDKDLATHITRTRLLHEGRKLSEITDQIRRALGVSATILPMSDERVETRVQIPRGEISFQEFFVKERWAPEVLAVRFDGAEKSRPAPECSMRLPRPMPSSFVRVIRLPVSARFSLWRRCAERSKKPRLRCWLSVRSLAKSRFQVRHTN